ncbi:MAG: FAD-dependent oxidoreductase [Candidatus Limiplasma sp.]|nr:FAD-dependent oxidoreductase [Candidatus Limiplasma sp.]MEA5144965.1 FAD-dependent oxidoreductase [Candidatus Limiplasma sp.]
MEMKTDILVVGAGMAGLTAAAYAAKAGKAVLVCEQAGRVGGLVVDFSVQGFHFDAGLRAVENSGAKHPMLRDLGIHVAFVPNPVTIRVQDRQVRLDQDGLAQYGAMLTALFPHNVGDVRAIISEIERVMAIMDVLYGVDNPLFLDLKHDPALLMHTILPWLVRYRRNMRKVKKLQQPIETHLVRLTDNRALIDTIAQHFFRNTPSFFALSYFGLYQDYQYPQGGTGALVAALAAYIQANQGEIRCHTGIVQVNPAARLALTAAGDAIRYQELVWAADCKALYAAVADQPALPKAFQPMRESVAHARGGDSVLTVFLALDLASADVAKAFGAHCFYTPATTGLSSLGLDSWQAAAQASDSRTALIDWITRYLSLTTYEISCPVLRDASLAPEGKNGLIVSTLFSYDLASHIEQAGWTDAWKALCIREMTRQLATALPLIHGKVLYASCATPLSMQRHTGNADGAITGWAFTKEIPAETRFAKITHSVRTPLPHVHQAGQWVFSPSGLPVSIITGKLAADAALRNIARASHSR